MFSLGAFFDKHFLGLEAERKTVLEAAAAKARGVAVDESLLDEKGRVGIGPHYTPKGRLSHFDELTNNIVFTLPPEQGPVRVIFRDAVTGDTVTNYADLTSVESRLNPDELTVLDTQRERLQARSASFYDGLNILVKDMVYDAKKHVLVVDVIAARYSTMQCDFPEGSPILDGPTYFKTGVLAGVYDRDGNAYFVERKDGLFAPFAGFLQPDRDGVFGYPETGKNELLEELIANGGDSEHPGPARVEISPPTLIAVSARNVAGPQRGKIVAGTLEAVTANFVPGVAHLIATNNSPDKAEHTSRPPVVIPLGPAKRDMALSVMHGLLTSSIPAPAERTTMPGVSLWGSVVFAMAARFGVPATVSRVPGTRVMVMNLGAAAVTPGLHRLGAAPSASLLFRAAAASEASAAGAAGASARASATDEEETVARCE